ncbi:MAG TPA: arylsulfotransferase family protein [Solirubrobacteraceae bacterium]|nr:arylsulfotransferase family protein [Solirubrobacteraceae bacterium]
MARLTGMLVTVVVALAPAAPAAGVTISPLPGTPDASPRTQISFLGVPAGEISHVSVVGSRSGAHAGELHPYASAPGASFVPQHGFDEGETVRVSAVIGPAGHGERAGSSFRVAELAPVRIAPMSKRTPKVPAGTVQSFVSAPSLKPPAVAVLTPSASPEDVFVAANGAYPQRGPMIFNRAGQLVWFDPAPPGNAAMDLQVEHYDGQPVLVWWQGDIDYGVGFGTDEIYSSSYRPIGAVHGGNGYSADLHEVRLTPSGSAFITAYTLVEANLSSVGGPSRAALQDAVVQEIDVKTGLVMFEWHADGHVPFGDSYWPRPSSPSRPWDYFHVNSISLDPWGDGNFLISSRNTWAGYEIDHETGRILWRLGGKQSSFKLGPGTETAWQHDMRWQPDHTITVFDNGDSPQVHPQTRVLQEGIDWADRTVSLISQDVHTPSLLANSQGSDQLLPDGDSFVGWGALPYVSEFSPTGEMIFNARLASPGYSYRAFTYPWSGTPAAPPALAVHAGTGSAVTAYASWNGATDVSAWRVLAGPSPAQLTPIATAPRTGFETAIALQSGQPDFAVQALDGSGAVLGTSGAVRRG